MADRQRWEKEVKSDTLSSLLDFFMSAFNLIVYRRGNYPEGAFFFTKNLGVDIPICFHPQIAEYIEMCSKKLISLLTTGQLLGVELHIVERKVTLERFVFTFSGNLSFDTIFKNCESKSSATMKLADMTSTLRNCLRRLSEIKPSPRYSSTSAPHLNCTRFKIKLGITEECLTQYNGKGPFDDEDDIYVFPWAKPSYRHDVKSQETRKPCLSTPNPNRINLLSPGNLERQYPRELSRRKEESLETKEKILKISNKNEDSMLPPSTSPDLFLGLEKDNVNRDKSPERQMEIVKPLSFFRRPIQSKDVYQKIMEARRASELPRLTPIDTFLLFEELLVNIFQLTYVKQSLVKDRDNFIRRRSEECFTKRNLSSPQMFRRDSLVKARLDLQTKPISPLSNPGYDTSPKSSTGRTNMSSPYRRPPLSSSRSVVQNLESAKTSPSTSKQNPGKSVLDSPVSSTVNSTSSKRPQIMGARRRL